MRTATEATAQLVTDPLSIPDNVRSAVEEHRDAADATRRLPPVLLSTLRAAGAFGLSTPREYGGFETSLSTSVRVLEGFGRLDGSVAWNVWNGNLGFVAAMLAPEAADAIWARSDDPVIANSARVTGTARQVDGGFVLSGRWDMVSAIDGSDWVGVFAIVTDRNAPRMTPDGSPDVRVFLTPTQAGQLLDTWHTNGMRGTGSNTILANELFIPDMFAISPLAPRRFDRPLYRIPAFTLASTGSAGVLLGMAQTMIDEIIDLAGGKATDNGASLADRSHARANLGAADAALRAARAGLYAATEAIDTAAIAAKPISPELRGALRASMVHVAQVARAVAVEMYQLASSSAVYAGRIDRTFRDIHVAAQHGLLNQTVNDLHGGILLGAPAASPIF